MQSIDIHKIEEEIYQETFDNTYKFLYMGMSDHIDIAINTLHTTIETLCIYSGNNQTGRGSLSQLRLDAELAATEVVLLELINKKKLTKQ